MRFCHETRDRRFYHRGGAVQENVLSHEKISCLKRKSHVSREYLLSYQFWAMRFSHETGDKIFSRWGPKTDKIRDIL